jgi:hypothetical protein
LIDGKPAAGGPGRAIEAPHRHVRLKCRLEGRDQDLKLLKRVRLVKSRNSVGRNRMSANRRPTIGYASCLRISVTEAGQITNRDELNCP